jgi:hypothetical protein
LRNSNFSKIIIYGYPYNSHTHSYIHNGYYKGFQSLGYETLWTGQSPIYESDFDNALVLTEGFADGGLPLNKTATYVVHYLGNKPERRVKIDKYLNNVGRLVDLRYNANCWHDKNYDYELDRDKAIKIGAGMYFEKGLSGYDIAYTIWATDLLPNEINLDDCFIQKERKIWYIGTVGGGNGDLGTCQQAPEYYDNKPDLLKFKEACQKNGIEFLTNCPWKNPISDEEAKELIQKSYLTVDIRHKAFKDWGYIPCRIWKNLSYGQVVGTNSKAVFDFCANQGFILPYSENPIELFNLVEDFQKHPSYTRKLMEGVRDQHTYINRCQELLKCLEL